MLKEKIHSIITLLSVIILLNVYGLILVSNVLYYHSHVTPDGKVISHAHPFNKHDDSQPKKAHHHSKLELLLLFSDSYNLNLFQAETKALSTNYFDEKPDYNNVLVLSKVFTKDSSRAPPKV